MHAKIKNAKFNYKSHFTVFCENLHHRKFPAIRYITGARVGSHSVLLLPYIHNNYNIRMGVCNFV